MYIAIYWKGYRIGDDIREVKRIKLTNEKLYLYTVTTKSEILLSNIKGFETITNTTTINKENNLALHNIIKDFGTDDEIKSTSDLANYMINWYIENMYINGRDYYREDYN